MTDTAVRTPATSPVEPCPDGTCTHPGWVLGIVLVGQFMAILDASIVNVAVPTIRNDLHASGAGLQMVVAGYTIAYAMLLITGARLGGRVGARRLFLAGLAVFTVASLACGLATTTGLLIGYRFVQGAGAALMVPQVLSLIQLNFEGAARARALSGYAAVIAGGAVVGQVAGGALVASDLWGTGWRPVFLVNVPIGVGLLVLGRRLLPRRPGHSDRRLDIPGLVALSAAIVLLVVPLVLGRELDWPPWGWAMLAASSLALLGFVGVERVVARRGGAPLIPGALLRAPDLVVAALVIFTAMASLGGFLFAMALHLQVGLGDSPLRAGLTFAPLALGFAAGSLSWQRLPAAWHRRLIPMGFVVGAAGYALLSLLARGGGHGGPALFVVMAGFGAGFGFAYGPILHVALRHVAPAYASDASGVLVTIVQLGQVIGVATFGTLFLGLVEPQSLPTTADAMAVTDLFLTATATSAALLGLRLTRRDPGQMGTGRAAV